MNSVRRHLRPVVWLALVAIASLALLPAVSHALARGGSGWAEICTPQGPQRLAQDDGGQAPAAAQMEHCPLCSLGHGGLAPPPAAPALPQPLAAARALPVPFVHAARPRPAWAPAQPRAPPARG